MVHDVSARTAEEAALACGCSVAQIVKSLVFVGSESETPLLLLVSGADRVDEPTVEREVGEGLRRADGRTVRELTGYAIGGVPPLGHETQMQTLMDRSLLDHPVVWAAAGTPHCVFAVAPADLLRACEARAAGLTA
ncbi:Peptidyl-dipeptidase dcp [Lutibaculum baratangense AMV1]|uniref:Peptidyl-dipeptidase dcp n=1 Tax=Lutibaculum baratangense AMV1 TaxID=631454 RepID=V4RAE3_9HYPH|nr:Peptidyl-dipeptidase dcp [Lutibaculum baratangense AMV1]